MRLQKKLQKQGAQGDGEYTVPVEEKVHRKLIKEVTRLLNADEYGLRSLAEDPEMIAMLNADVLLDSPNTHS